MQHLQGPIQQHSFLLCYYFRRKSIPTCDCLCMAYKGAKMKVKKWLLNNMLQLFTHKISKKDMTWNGQHFSISSFVNTASIQKKSPILTADVIQISMKAAIIKLGIFFVYRSNFAVLEIEIAIVSLTFIWVLPLIETEKTQLKLNLWACQIHLKECKSLLFFFILPWSPFLWQHYSVID